MGRKPKLTPEIQGQLEMMLGNNVPVVCACEAVGLDESTFYDWINKGQKPGKANQIYAKFAKAISQVRAVGELDLISKIQNAAAKDWRAAVFLLQVRRPGTYKPATRLEHTGGNGAPLAMPAGGNVPAPIINLRITGGEGHKEAKVIEVRAQEVKEP